MKWMTYTTPFSDRQMAICFMDDGSSISGYADSIPEYQAWLEEGNTAEPWQPE
jgi:hypothetical protein